MGYVENLTLGSQTVSSISPFGNVQYVEFDSEIFLNSGESIDFASLNVIVDVTQVLGFTPAITVIFNGQSLGNIPVPSPHNEQQVFKAFPVGDFIQSGKNKVSVKLDSNFNNIDWTVTIGLNYHVISANTKPTTDPTISSPPTGNQASGTQQDNTKIPWNKILLAGGVIAAVGVGGYLVFGTKRGRSGVRYVYSRARNFRR